MFREASSRAQAEGQADRAEVGADRAKRLEPQLSKLTVSVPKENQVPDLRLELDGHDLPLSLQGTAIPVDGGEHTLLAEAPGHQPFRIQVGVTDPAGSVTVPIPRLTPAPVVPETPAQPAAEPAPAPVDQPTDEGAEGSSLKPILGLALAGAGLVSLGAGVYFGLEAKDTDDEAEELCPRSRECENQEGLELTEDAQSEALTANILYGVGGAAIIAGAILYFTADDSSDGAQAERPAFSVGSARIRPDAVISPAFSGISIRSEF
jgi:hypothetical protein